MDQQQQLSKLAMDIALNSGAIAAGIVTTETLKGGPPSIDLNYVELGQGVLLTGGVIVGSRTKVGDFLTTRLGSVISHDVIIEDHVFIGPGVVIGSGARIGKGAFIGAGATVMLERTVGAGSLVGAGAVVSKDVPDFVSVAGVPAREIGKR